MEFFFKRQKTKSGAEVLIDNGGCFSLGSVDCKEDLKPVPGRFNINAPPGDGRCQCCGRHMSDLKPFGKAGDPLVGDFDGSYLVKTGHADKCGPEPDNYCVSSSWECRDCIILSTDEYWEKRLKSSIKV